MQNIYKINLKKYLDFNKQFQKNISYEHRLEMQFESLKDWSLFHTLDEVEEWFIEKRKNHPMIVEVIPLNEMREWTIDNETGNISRIEGDFFTIHGVRTVSCDREVGDRGWDQPIITQVGYNGGILGIVRKRFKGIPHYLIEAKAEPGNYEKLQLSPTLQATFSNINASHKGRKPYLAELFQNPEAHNVKVLYDAWLAEDGGRLYLKRNRNMLIEIPEEYELEKPNDNYIWMSLYQIKELLNKNAWIAPHIRGILAHV